jgi:hypothetical protein
MTYDIQSYVPTRTSSAPPDEHASEGFKPHYQPAKTYQYLVRPYNIRPYNI